LTVAAPAAALKQQGKMQLAVKITRLYNFAGPVPLKVTPPGGAGGLKIKPVTIAEKQNEGVIEIEANKDAVAGVHKLTIQASPKLTNQELPVTQEIALTVEKAEPPKK
jgi:hypothetical protein